MNAETVYDTDQVEVKTIPAEKEEVPDANDEGRWLSLKNDLQTFLCQKDNEDQPAFPDEAIFDWIEKNAKQFDLFFKQVKQDDAHKLVAWHAAARDGDAMNDIDLIHEWSKWKQTRG